MGFGRYARMATFRCGKWRGRLPLGRSDECEETGLEWWSRPRIGRPVGLAEDSPLGRAGDVPAVLMEKAVVEAADEDEIVQVGGPSLGPGLDVMDLKPAGVAASGMLAVATVTVVDELPEPSRNPSGPSTDTDGHSVRPGDGSDGCITGKSLCRLVGDDGTVVQLGDAPLAVQRIGIGEHGDIC